MPEEGGKEAPAEDEPMEQAAEAAAEDAAQEPEEAKELEADAAPDGRPKLQAGDVCFLSEDRTLNVLSTVGGKLLTSLSDGGCQYLLAGARASAGLRGGRHFFEVAIAENRNPSEPAGARTQSPKPRWLVRVGVATSDSSLFLSDGAENVAFDSEGFFLHGTEKKRVSAKFGHNQVVALLLNLDEKSPNAHTISLFCDGARVSEPQPLPEALRGKPLYPAVTYRNVTLQANFGPRPLQPLPFKCCTWQEAAAADCELRREPPAGPKEVLLPVGVPDEATFDWLDQFLEGHRNYVEISDRSILEWAKKSGIPRPGGYSKRSSNDRPEPAFGLPLMDDGSIKRVLMAAAPLLQRNYVVMEVKGNLLAEDRKATMARFAGSDFKRAAEVVMGEPPAEYRTWIQELMLKDKRSKAEAEAKRKKQEATRKKAEEDAKRKKLQEERKRKLESAKKTDGEKKEAEEDDEKKEETPAAEQIEEIKVELTEQEKTLTFRKKDIPDLDPRELASSYADFTIAVQDEGFDEVRFSWADKAQSEEYLRKYVLSRKLTQRIETLQPSEWFKEKWSEWTKSLGAWKKKHQEFKQKKAPKKDGEVGKEVDAEDLDVFAVEDVTDIGNGEPLFANWAYEDWALLSLRFELHLLVHAFRHDVDDPDRPTFTESHLGFYYTRYFKKSFDVKTFGFAKLVELIGIMEDTVQISSTSSMIEAQLSNDTPMDNFVKLTEDHRRDRQRRLDAGDETALLKFSRPAPAAPPPRQAPPAQRSWPSQGRDERSSRGSYSSSGPPQAYSSQKRSYAPPPSYPPPPKYQRSTYSGGPPRYGGYEGGGGGGGYHRR